MSDASKTGGKTTGMESTGNISANQLKTVGNQANPFVENKTSSFSF